MRQFILSAVFAVLGTMIVPAQAAPITYTMTFFDEGGAKFGSGTFSYDPAVTVDIYDADTGTGPCDPVTDPDICVFLATWTPVQLEGAVGPIQFGRPSQTNSYGFGDVFVEGTYSYDGRSRMTTFAPGAWVAWNGDSSNDATFLFLPYPDFPAHGGGGRFDFIDNFGGEFTGTVDYRLAEIPLPAALWLFLLGASGLGASLARRRNV